MFCFAAVPYIVLIPIFAKDILGGDSRHLGFMLGGFGLGAVIGALYIASKIELNTLPRHIWRMQFLFGAALLAFCFVTKWHIAMLFTPLLGFAMVSSMISSNSLIQALVDEDKRGRVLSYYSFGLLGFGPVGALLFGKIADYTGVQTACLVCAAACLAIGMAHRRRLKDYDAAVPGILASKGL